MLKVSSRKVTPDALGATDLPERGGVQGFPFIISAKRAKPHGDDLAVLGEPVNGLIQKGFLVAGEITKVLGQAP